MSENIKAISMPKWGIEMTEGDVSEWHFAVGDQVNAGDDLVDIETSKIVNTLVAHSSGTLRRILAQPGETHKVGALLGVLVEGEATDVEIAEFIASASVSDAVVDIADEPASPGPNPAPAAPGPVVQETAAPAPAISTLAQGDDDSAVHASPVARKLAKKYGVNLHNVTPTGRHGRVGKRDLEDAIEKAGGHVERHSGAAVRGDRKRPDDSGIAATPVARRVAKKLGVNLHDCRASGRHGRVNKEDVEAAHALLSAAGKLPDQSALASAETVLSGLPRVEEFALTGMRKTIADRLQSSKQTAPHFRVKIDVELDNLLRVRSQINAANTDAKVSVNDFLIKACAMALVKEPGVNIQFDGDSIKQFADADISVAVAIDNGLITPIVKNANRLGLLEISNNMRDMVTRAKLGKLRPEEFQGGTFSISNLGMFGVSQFDAIINPPQGAILAVGAGEKRPVVKQDELCIMDVVTLTLSCDHRLIDGALAAKFLQRLKGYIQQPATMLS